MKNCKTFKKNGEDLADKDAVFKAEEVIHKSQAASLKYMKS